MNNLPEAHKRGLASIAFILIAALGVWLFVVNPLKQKRDDLINTNESLSAQLSADAMPKKPEKVHNLLHNQNLELERLRQKYNGSWDRVMTQFSKQIDLYDSVLGFRKSITLLDYQELFLDTKSALKSKGIILNDEILGLSETSSDTRSYRIYSQLLLVRSVADLAHKHNLSFTDEFDPAPPRSKDGALAARISALPVRTYVTNMDDTPFVEEFSIRCSVTGSAPNFAAFLADLTSPERFIGSRQISVQKSYAGSDPRVDRVTGTLVCVAYLMMREKEDTRPPEAEQTLRWTPGA